VDVQGKPIAAIEMREQSRLTGGQTGDNSSVTWFDGANGLPLSGTWSTDVHTPTPVGTSTLTASGHFQLEGLEPQT
jgi:hypothetical protein